MTFIRHAAAAAACTLLALAAQAQQVYRIVGPDGRVTFSDRPPAAGAEAAPVGAGAQGSGGSEALPYQLRQIAARFPVTLYTGSDCAPCDSARNLLVSRGVPFTERTVGSNEDIEALRRLSGESSLPFGTIGGQQLKGFSDSEWSQYLDAAGYPRQSQLPPGYRRPPATPLVAVQARPAAPEAESAPAAPAARPAAPATPPTGRTPTNPAGIVF
ncbi:glutaredoxin family protein [Alicycliphilus denitrificans]|uniref:Glutaredoxin family protein n=1 Tax=Alicycliphilus denitrificans TaxID=179636 RepID=A0A858ZTW5_9BURK|nr:glutaredoxin family protein [Alicycliphilus denitrificans]QKD44258.1 glutaredoxin family protein [Alicycliphilus denitrificans]